MSLMKQSKFHIGSIVHFITLADPHDLCVIVAERPPPEEIARNIASMDAILC